MYESNLFKSTSDFNYSKFPCFKTSLTISEAEAWNTLSNNKVTTPYSIAEKNIYFTDLNLSKLDFFKEIGTGKVRNTIVSNETALGSRIIGGMLYRAFASYLNNLGFENFGITAGSVYYRPDNPMYIKKIKGLDNEGDYIVFRGFGPKIHAMSVPGLVVLFVETRSIFRIEVTQTSWSKWLDYPVAIMGRSFLFRGYAQLKKIDNKREIGILRKGESEFEVPLNKIYVPASSGTLGKRGVYESMIDFAQFRDQADRTISSSFDFLIRVFNSILVDDSFKIKMDREGEMILQFNKIDFRTERG